MAYLAAVDVTVTLPLADIYYPSGGLVKSFPTVAFGGASLQYPANGIPMPAIGYFGMKKEIKRVFIEQPANGFIYHFDRANHKLRIYLGAARDVITAVFTGNAVTPAFTGNAVTPAFTGNAVTPAFTGNAVTPAFTGNAVTPVFTGNAVSPGTPAGSLANLAFLGDALATHLHVENVAENYAANANTGSSSGGTPGGNVSGNFSGTVLANITPEGTIGNITPAGTIGAITPAGTIGAITPAGTVAITGGNAVAEAALAEMDDGVAPAATTLYMTVEGH